MIKKLLLDTLYPPRLVCWACDLDAEADAVGLCAHCAAAIREAGPRPAPEGIERLVAGAWYDPALHGAMHRLKYRRAAYLAEGFAALLPPLADFGADAVVPVPLSSKRLRERGYNQSALLAEAAVRREGVALPIEPGWLLRTRHTGTQTALGPEAREANVRGAFRADPAVRGKHILLLDDVVTLGHTLSACASALLEAGAARVCACAACCAVGDGREGYMPSASSPNA